MKALVARMCGRFHVLPPVSDLFHALVSPPGQGAIGVVHLEGPGAGVLLDGVFVPSSVSRSFSAGRLLLGRIVDGGNVLDEAIVEVVVPGSVFRVNCHGGAAAVRGICALFERKGARRGEGWEPVFRRFVRGEISAVRFEAVCSLVAAPSETYAGLVLAAAGMLEEAAGKGDLETLSDLAAAGGVMRVLGEEHEVAFFGPENAGKSTLVNRLCRRTVSVVSPLPGTTRDPVGGGVEWKGVALRLLDLAGFGEESDELRRLSVRKTVEALGNASVLVEVRSPDTISPESVPDVGGRPVVRVFNKSDLGERAPEGFFPVSALSGAGADTLLDAIVGRLLPEPPRPGVFTRRQERVIRNVLSGKAEPQALLRCPPESLFPLQGPHAS